MSTTVLVYGRLLRNPQRNKSKAGKIYVTASVRASDAWWRVTAFDDDIIAELLALADGDSLAATGSMKAEVYDNGAGPKLGLSMIIDRMISRHRRKPSRSAVQHLNNSAPTPRAELYDGAEPPWEAVPAMKPATVGAAP